jgi:hypothetical protein
MRNLINFYWVKLQLVVLVKELRELEGQSVLNRENPGTGKAVRQ